MTKINKAFVEQATVLEAISEAGGTMTFRQYRDVLNNLTKETGLKTHVQSTLGALVLSGKVACNGGTIALAKPN